VEKRHVLAEPRGSNLGMVNFDNLTLKSRREMTPERIEASIGTDCLIINDDRTGYERYVVVSAEATDDPFAAAIHVEPKRVWRF
jgi:hypothetical protein